MKIVAILAIVAVSAITAKAETLESSKALAADCVNKNLMKSASGSIVISVDEAPSANKAKKGFKVQSWEGPAGPGGPFSFSFAGVLDHAIQGMLVIGAHFRLRCLFHGFQVSGFLLKGSGHLLNFMGGTEVSHRVHRIQYMVRQAHSLDLNDVGEDQNGQDQHRVFEYRPDHFEHGFRRLLRKHWVRFRFRKLRS